MKKNYLLAIILFILILFSFPSIASIPGDFDNDGKVDFEDLMLFALAYGSTSGSSNWNPSCDLHVDGKVNFEDLMIFAINYGNTLPVHNITQNTYHETIQEAIDVSLYKDVILVSPGIYYENIVFNNKSISVQSINPSDPVIVASTIIDGGSIDSVVKFIGNSAPTLTGFTIQSGSAYHGGGIHVSSQCYPNILINVITGNTAIKGGGGIYIDQSFPNINGNIITGNITTDTYSVGGGIHVNYSSPTITGNTISNNRSNYGGGMYVNYDSHLYPDTVRPTGWGTIKEDIPTGTPLVPAYNVEYTIAGNTFLGNLHGDPPVYKEAAHVYFDKT